MEFQEAEVRAVLGAEGMEHAAHLVGHGADHQLCVMREADDLWRRVHIPEDTHRAWHGVQRVLRLLREGVARGDVVQVIQGGAARLSFTDR